jgi:integrase/recombinase XerD
MTAQQQAPARPDAEAAVDLTLVESFTDALWLERGLSSNTLAAYRSDLTAFLRWLGVERGRGACEAQRLDLLDYLALLSQQGRKPRSTARLLS